MTDGAATTKGQLLIAGPMLEDPNFRRTIVLMIEHTDEGALGVVLNRPSPIDVAEALPDWADLTADPAVVFLGGPVEQGSVIGLGRQVGEDAPTGFTPVLGPVGVIDLNASPVNLLGDVDAIRLFTGYAGWGEGQLEGELEIGGWFVVDADPADAFTSEPDDLWRRVLARQPTQDVAKYANFPDDLSFN
jgi:putative transcriptional regulator